MDTPLPSFTEHAFYTGRLGKASRLSAKLGLNGEKHINQATFKKGRTDTMVIKGEEAKALVISQLEQHENGLQNTLAKYRLVEAVNAWHETIRAVEEFINLPLFSVPNKLIQGWLYGVRLDEKFLNNPVPTWLAIQHSLKPYVESAVISRFNRIVLVAAAMAQAFRRNRRDPRELSITLDTIRGAVDYFQSRRRHMLSILYTMPYACVGKQTLHPYDALTVFLPQIEHSCIAITGLKQKLALLDALPDFYLEVGQFGINGSHGLDNLDDHYLEPERASIQVMQQLRSDQMSIQKLEPIDSRKVFSSAELRNSLKIIEGTYDAFGLKDSDFSAMGELIMTFADHVRDEYFIEIDKQMFLGMINKQTKLEPKELVKVLVNKPSRYTTNTSAYQPFLDLGDRLVSNVNLLSRFLYSFKNVHLGSRRRFQIHAGFIFEEMVKQDLKRMNFDVTDIKRINRKEFDVVAVKQGVIFNLQCKNNWIDLSKIETERDLFVRYNRRLSSYYSRALTKEKNREDLLRNKLKMDRVVHYVISRFPVISTDPAVINYNQIERLLHVI